MTIIFYQISYITCDVGWEAASKLYPQPDILDSKDIDLSDKTYLITGANAGNYHAFPITKLDINQTCIAYIRLHTMTCTSCICELVI
jgi:hypothetical protein